jgi:hypothetical protein
LLFNFALNCAIRRVQVYQNGLKLNGTHQILVCADDVNILGGSVHTVKKNTEILFHDSKETGLVVNADKTKYMAFYRDQNAGRSHNSKIDNNSFEMVEEYEHLGKPELIRIIFRKKLRVD